MHHRHGRNGHLADRPQDNLQGAGAAVHDDGVPNLADVGEGPLQSGAVRPQRETAALQAFVDPGQDSGAILLGDVDGSGWNLHGIPL
jgi:hypothetical protein